MVAGFTGEFVKSKDAVEAFQWVWLAERQLPSQMTWQQLNLLKETYEKVEVEKDENSRPIEKRCHVAGFAGN